MNVPCQVSLPLCISMLAARSMQNGQRPATGIFIYTHPKDQIQKNHNKEALKLLEVKKSQATIEQQAIGSAFIPVHKFIANFLEYYEEYVKLNTLPLYPTSLGPPAPSRQ
jgi:hypothetical protein